jgi:CRP/FNR family transcriptional regulator
MADNTKTQTTLLEHLASLDPQWQNADKATVDRLLSNARTVRLDRADFVFQAGDLCDAFLVLLEGAVRVQLISSGGREVTLYRIGPGGTCFLTTSCLLSKEQYPAEALAESQVLALAIPSSDFQQALENSRWFRNLVFDGFSNRLREVINRIEELSFTSIDCRLAAALIRLDSKGVTEVTHQDLAVELGTAREVVSRHLKRFESRGLVKLGRGRISVIDLSAMRSLASSVQGD